MGPWRQIPGDQDLTLGLRDLAHILRLKSFPFIYNYKCWDLGHVLYTDLE